MADQTGVTDAETRKDPGVEALPSDAHSAPAPPSRPRRFFRAHPHARIILILLVLAVLIAAFFGWRYLSSYESTDDAQIDGHLMPISARISGYVQKVNVDDNQVVKAGAVLVEIDPRDYQIAVEQARAALTDAQASAQALNINVPIASVSTSSELSSAQASVDEAQARISGAQQKSHAAQAQLTQAQANNAKAQSDLGRYKQLIAKREISEQMYDQAVAAANSSAAAVAEARASASAANEQIAQARGQLAQAEANLRSSETGPRRVASTRARALSAEATVRQKQAALDQAELNLEYTKIIAPMDGIVAKNVEVGMNVQPGQQLLTIVPLADVWVTADFKETQLKDMRPGQHVEIHVDASGRTYKGHVDSIAGTSGARLSLLPPENATGNYVKVVQRVPVKIVLDPGQNQDHYLRLGMSCEPKVFIR